MEEYTLIKMYLSVAIAYLLCTVLVFEIQGYDPQEQAG